MVTSNSNQSHSLETQDKKRLQQYPDAHFAYWGKMAKWTLDEAVALTFGKAPQRFKWEYIEREVRAFPFAEKYSERRELALRAKLHTPHTQSVLPSVFIAWAQKMEIPVPNELIASVEKYAPLKPLKPLKPMKENKDDHDSLPETERNSLLKLVLGMAISAYKYDPKETRNHATGTSRGSIQYALNEHDLNMDEDTIRKYLNEASERFNPFIPGSNKPPR
jgi:hypothetical protein